MKPILSALVFLFGIFVAVANPIPTWSKRTRAIIALSAVVVALLYILECVYRAHQRKVKELETDLTDRTIKLSKKEADFNTLEIQWEFRGNEIATLEEKARALQSELDEFKTHKLRFELDLPRSKVTVNGDVDEFNIVLDFHIRFVNSHSHTLAMRGVNVSLMKKNAGETESAVTTTDQKFYTIVMENDNPVTRFWENRNIPVQAGEVTFYHRIQGHLSVSGDYREILDKDCFLRVTMEAMNQPPYSLDFDVKWQNINLGWIDITPRT